MQATETKYYNIGVDGEHEDIKHPTMEPWWMTSRPWHLLLLSEIPVTLTGSIIGGTAAMIAITYLCAVTYGGASYDAFRRG